MIFASDLDQTLIYSSKHFDETCGSKRLIETLDGKEISYMTEAAIHSLQEIAQEVMFIPVTTRTVAQYQRIRIFQDVIRPIYAVTSNGGTILKNGQIDEEWTRQIMTRVQDASLSAEEILARFNELVSDDWFRSGKMADDLFYYCIVERDKLPLEEIHSFGEWCLRNGWKLSIQGRKVYLVPEAVNKRDAVVYLKEQEGKTRIFSSGDSLLDAPLLLHSDYAIAPAHGELYDTRATNSFTYTKSSGPQATEELLHNILLQISSINAGKL